MIEIGPILMVGGLIFLSGSALVAFFWAVKDGQFRNLDKAPEVIFDEDEPVGKATDRFPHKHKVSV